MPQQGIANRSMQQMNLQQPPQQQQQQQQQPPPQIKQQPPTTPQPQRLKPILKQSTPVTGTGPAVTTPPAPTPVPPVPAPTPVVQEEKIDGQANDSMEVESQEGNLPRWKRSKIPGFKVNRKLKRLRMNQRLRKTLQPKNAIMVLNEMKTGVQFTFPETQSSLQNSLFLVHAEIDGKTYIGQGLSKPLARQNAAENALKCLLLEKMTTAAMKARIDAESDGQSNQVSETTETPMKEENQSEVTPMATDVAVDETEEIPWSSLASFALYKLFLEWQNQGTVVPVPRPGVVPGKVKKEQKAVVQKELPANATSIHPVMLLNQMRPGLTYVEVNRTGNPPNIMFTLSVEIDGVEYSGSAKNKKDAKKIAAKAALQALYDLTYPEEIKVESAEEVQAS
ncbi:interleukin enhancer-binding factor 3 homolog isoform X2 [Orussus abietinus]|nr:interleukin enhancer-binding factor 3 homolog isoform X2 [Orussus abietinus]XP_023290361.1 interleukin enhancer-binding factor 3 homolog isoform X2 [Orussus abietinus]